MSLTFAEAAGKELERISAAWSTAGSLSLWTRAIDVHAAGFRDKALEAVTIEDIVAGLSPIWRAKPALAAKVRRHWERVLDHRGEGSSEAPRRNPAAWSLELQARLRPRPTLGSGAATYQDLPVLLSTVRSGRGLARAALELSVLTCVPVEAVCRLIWDDIAETRDGWILTTEAPVGRSGKGVGLGRRLTPLSNEAVAVLRSRGAAAAGSAIVFAHRARAEPIDPGGVWILAQRLFGQRAARLDAASVEAAFRAWACEDWRRPEGGSDVRAAADVVDVALGQGSLLFERASFDPALSREIRQLFGAWSDFLTRA